VGEEVVALLLLLGAGAILAAWSSFSGHVIGWWWFESSGTCFGRAPDARVAGGWEVDGVREAC
jgi:hypothetical protein